MTADFVSIPADKARDLAQYHRDRSNAGPAVVSHDAARWHRETADLLDPPPTLREQVTRKGLGIAFAGATSMSAEMAEGVAARYADAVLAVVADWLAAQPLSTRDVTLRGQRDHDVRLIRDGGAS